MEPASSRRPQLPALSYLDIDQSKADEPSRNSEPSPTHSHSHASTATYSNTPSQPQSAWPPLHADPREVRPDEYDAGKTAPRHSLPSISEALGVDSASAYAPPKLATQHPLSSGAASPSSPTYRRPFGPNSSHAHSAPYQPSYRRDSAEPQSHSESHKSIQPPHRDSRPPPHLHIQRPECIDPYGRSESPARHASTMAPPAIPYGYAPYHTETSAARVQGPIYRASSHYAPPPTPAPAWKSEAASSRVESEDYSPHSSTYGKSVKRHLDLYDLEAALSEIHSTTGIVSDFSRRYSERMHETARGSTPSLATLPGLVEVDDMISKSRIQVDALHKIRDVIVAEQAAYEQQLADQRHQAKIYRDAAPPPPVPEALVDSEDGKGGGFAGGEPKKRRGRAAPPGRCHSCNRAETPEWRRGPDGARTLCNACGLHYAKLTRKQSNANKAANSGNPHLRPKESV